MVTRISSLGSGSLRKPLHSVTTTSPQARVLSSTRIEFITLLFVVVDRTGAETYHHIQYHARTGLH